MKNLFCFILFFIFIFQSCRKDEIIFIPDQNIKINSESFLSLLTELPVSYKLNLNEDKNTLFAHDNIIIEFPYQSLSDDDGKIITGEVKLQFKEFSNKRSNLLYCPSTVYENKILDFSKMIYLKLSQNGKTLNIVKPIEIYLPASDLKQNYNLYTGLEFEQGISWVKQNGESEKFRSGKWDFVYQNEFLQLKGFKISVLGDANWHTVAKEVDSSGEPINICLRMSSTYNRNNSLAFLVIDGNNTVLKLESDGKSSAFCLSNIRFEKSVSVKIIIFSDFGNSNYYFGTANVVIDKNTELTIIPDKKNIEEIKEALKSL